MSTPSQFRVDRKKFGLTYSCPAALDRNPIASCEALRDKLVEKHGVAVYAICEEMHKDADGEEHETKNHFHVYIAFEVKVNSTNARVFDVDGVHPNILNRTPGNGWLAYVLGKDGKVQVRNITNMQDDPYAEAFLIAASKSVDEAMRMLTRKRPRDVAINGRSVRANLTAHGSLQRDRRWTGRHRPRIKSPWPATWNGKTKWIEGPSGVGKTSWAKYWMHLETNGDYLYVKGHPDGVKKLKPHHKGIIFDDMTIPQTWTEPDYNSLLDVENGGMINLRYGAVNIPADVKRLILSNPGNMYIPDAPALNRRYDKHSWGELMWESLVQGRCKAIIKKK